jgi:type I site-specific restriction endonuclease
MSWRKYIVNANESRTPQTFKASDEARHQHNQEVFGLESRIVELDDIISHHIEDMENFKHRKNMQIWSSLEEIKQLKDIISNFTDPNTEQYQAGYKAGRAYQQEEIKKIKEALESTAIKIEALKDGKL